MKVLGVVHPPKRGLSAWHSRGDGRDAVSLAVGLALLHEYWVSLFEMSEGDRKQESGSCDVKARISGLAAGVRKALSIEKSMRIKFGPQPSLVRAAH